MYKIIQKTILFLWVLVSPFIAFSQTECDETLTESISLFEEGMYDQVIKKIEKFQSKKINCKFSKEDKNLIAKLLLSSYLEIDELEIGQKRMDEFLQKNSNYELNSKDPDVFKDLYSKYLVAPRLAVQINAGFGKITPDIQKVYGIMDSANYSNPYTSQYSPFYGVAIEWFAFKRLSFSFNMESAYLEYKRTITAYEEDNNFSLTFNESMLKERALFKFTYYPLPRFRIQPAFFAGLQSSFLYYSDVDISYTFQAYSDKLEQYSTFNRNSGGIDLTKDRTIYNVGLAYGATFYYKINSFRLFLEIKHTEDFLQHNLPKERYSIPNIVFGYQYIDDDFCLTDLSFSLGVSWTFMHKIKYLY